MWKFKDSRNYNDATFLDAKNLVLFLFKLICYSKQPEPPPPLDLLSLLLFLELEVEDDSLEDASAGDFVAENS